MARMTRKRTAEYVAIFEDDSTEWKAVPADELAARKVGRPSLSGRAEHSPQVTFRMSEALKARAEERAAAEQTTISMLARRALEQYLA